MFILSVLLFSIAVTVVSCLASRPANLDRGKVATSTTLIAWGSMLTGLLLSRVMH